MNLNQNHEPVRLPICGRQATTRSGRAIVTGCLLLIALVSMVMAATAMADAGGRADLTRLVVVGDSISAGYQNSSLMAAQRVNGFASLIARQAGVELTLPLISYPGFPAALQLVALDPRPIVEPITPNPAEFGTRINWQEQAYNLSVPGARVGDALRADADLAFFSSFVFGYYPYRELSQLVHALPGPMMSQVDRAEQLEPTTVLLWLGSNDTLRAMINADPAFVTPEEEFRAAYEEVISRLAATGATMVVGNIPDVTTIPFLTSAEDVSAILGIPIEFLPAALGLGPGDYVTPFAFEYMEAGVLPLPPQVVLTAAEVQQIQTATAVFNGIIAEQAALYGAPLVDVHAVLNMVRDYGIVIGGQRLTTRFLGGVFTLDGIHPTNTGHGVIANEFIKALNTNFNAGIPPVAVVGIKENDPLVFDGVGQPAAAFGVLDRASLAPGN